MKCVVLVCLFLILAEFSAFACICDQTCHHGHVCVGTAPNKFCVCIDDGPVTGRRAVRAKGVKKFGNKKSLKQRTKHLKAMRLRKKAKNAKKLHRKKDGKKILNKKMFAPKEIFR